MRISTSTVPSIFLTKASCGYLGCVILMGRGRLVVVHDQAVAGAADDAAEDAARHSTHDAAFDAVFHALGHADVGPVGAAHLLRLLVTRLVLERFFLGDVGA